MEREQEENKEEKMDGKKEMYKCPPTGGSKTKKIND